MIGRKNREGTSRRSARHRRDLGDVDPYSHVGADEAAAAQAPPVDDARTEGPFDVSEVADPAEGDRLDLGGIWLPGRPGMELRLEVHEESGQVMSAACVIGNSALQLQAFAAPRSGGLWRDIRREITDDLEAQGGGAHETDGPFGVELLAEVPAQLPDGRIAAQPARLIGVEGPRWVLQGVLTGEAAQDRAAAEPLEHVLRDIVVVRGDGPMARGEPLELRLPPQGPQMAAAAEPDQAARPPLEPFARGPEITEMR